MPGTLPRVSATDADLALRYLADGGFTPIGPDRWRWDGTSSEEMSDEDVAFHTAFEITADEGLDAVQRVHTALGLLDLTCAFEVLTHLNAYVCNNADPAVADAFWAGFRVRMAVPEPIEHLRLHLRTYWFWGHTTAKTAFDALLAHDVRRLAAAGRLPELAKPCWTACTCPPTPNTCSSCARSWARASSITTRTPPPGGGDARRWSPTAQVLQNSRCPEYFGTRCSTPSASMSTAACDVRSASRASAGAGRVQKRQWPTTRPAATSVHTAK
jgi:hypothetical protein